MKMRGVKKVSPLHLILALSLILSAAGIWWGLPSLNGWAPDEIFPSRVLDGLLRAYSNGWFDKYPPLHFYLLSVIYAPFLLLHALHVLDLRQLSGYTVLYFLGRMLSVAMAVFAVYFVFKIGEEIRDRKTGLGAALITALIVPFEYYAKTINLDVPYVFWFVLSLLFFVRIVKTHRRRDYLLFTAAAVLAVCTKDQAYGLYVLAPFAIVFSDIRWKKTRGRPPSFFRALLDPTYLYCLLLGAGLFGLVHNLLFNFRGFTQHIELITGPASKDFQMYANTLAGQLGLLGLTLRNIRFSLGWPLFILCAAGLAKSLIDRKKDSRLLWLLLFAVSYYVFYIALIRYDYDRFNLPVSILLSFFGGGLLSDVARGRWGGNRTVRAAAILIFAYSFFYSLSVDVLMITDSRYRAEKWMKKNVGPEAVVGLASPLEYSPRLDGFRWISLPLSPATLQREPAPDYILFVTEYGQAFPEDSKEGRFFSSLVRSREKYRQAFRYKTSLPWLPLRTEGIMTNIKAISPEIQIFKRVGTERTIEGESQRTARVPALP